MTDDTVISVENVSKAYRIWQTPAARLTSPIMAGMGRRLLGGTPPGRSLVRRAESRYRDFWALKDISFDVRRGEAIGIIGRNGSGKSTLLQIIAGTLQPTTGRAKVHGRVAALLELGSGFNPEFSGRENVFLNGAVLGLSRREVEERFDAIASFANIGEFIDHPVKTYSSGMQMRLAFAVAAHVDPDVLIVDESLAVGDARFQLKCATTIDRFLEEGVTLLFVSHDLNMVKRLCNRAMLLEVGRTVYSGGPNDVANLYSKLIADGGTVEGLVEDIRALREREGTIIDAAPFENVPPQPVDPTPRPSDLPDSASVAMLRSRVVALESVIQEAGTDPDWRNKVDTMIRQERGAAQNETAEFAYGGELGRILGFAVTTSTGEPRTWFTTGEDMVIAVRVEALSRIQEPIFALRFKDPKGQEIYGTNTLYSRQPAPPLEPGDRRVVWFSLRCNLMPGEYFVSLGFTQFVGDELVVIHRRYDAAKFSVHGVDRCFGIANCYARISVEPDTPEVDLRG